MRMMLKVQVDNEAGNRAIKDGSMKKIMGKFMEQFKPETSLFTVEDGCRMAYFVLDVKEATQMPSIGEPFWMGLNANITFAPVMSPEELSKGLEALAKMM